MPDKRKVKFFNSAKGTNEVAGVTAPEPASAVDLKKTVRKAQARAVEK